MKKILILILILITLNGCDSNNGSKQTAEDGDSEKYVALEAKIDSLLSDIETYKEETEILENKILSLEMDLDSKNTSLYKDYMISFSYDMIQALDDFKTYKGIITAYYEKEKLLEVAPVEFIYVNDEKRIAELNIDIDTSLRQGDQVIYINENDKVTYSMNDIFKLYVFDWDESGGLVEELIDKVVDTSIDNLSIYNLYIVNGQLIRMTENYYN